MIAAAWHGQALPDVPDRVLALSQRLARRHMVERQLLGTYRARFPASAHRDIEAQAAMLSVNLGEAACRLRQAGVGAVLIKSGLEAAGMNASGGKTGPIAAEYGDFDLVVGAEGWNAAWAALEGWGRRKPPHALEPHKVLVEPERGPGAHLHRDAEWFGVQVIQARDLHARGRPLREPAGLLVPIPADELRLWVAHAVFQNLAFDLSEMLEIRRLADPEIVAEATELAAREGWGGAFTDALSRARRAIVELDAGYLPTLPVPLPPLPSLLHGWRHAAHLLGAGFGGSALREIALRPALIAAKQRRRWLR
ncbi:MAG: hypothetical protein ABI838_08765 [Chloroflexota bacterium]